MRAYFRQSMTALAVLLIGASVASAFPINNLTDTDANGPGLSGFSFTLVSTTTGATLSTVGNVAREFSTVTSNWTRNATPNPNAVADNVNNSGFTASTLGTTGAPVVRAQTLSAASYSALQPRNWATFCVELTEGLNQNNVVTAIEQIPPAIALPDGTGYIAQPLQANALRRIAGLIANRNNYAALAGVSNADVIGAATQLAIWEIIYEAGIGAQGSVKTLNSSGRGFSVAASTGTSTAATNRNAARNLADKMLEYTWNNGNVRLGTGYIFRSGIRFVGTSGTGGTGDYLYREDTTSQTIVSAVPEPSALAIAGLGALGFLGYGLRRRVKKA